MECLTHILTCYDFGHESLFNVLFSLLPIAFGAGYYAFKFYWLVILRHRVDPFFSPWPMRVWTAFAIFAAITGLDAGMYGPGVSGLGAFVSMFLYVAFLYFLREDFLLDFI